MKDPIEIQLPSRDRTLIVCCMDNSRDSVPLALFDDLPLDHCHSPVIKSIVSELSKVNVSGLTHVVNCSIASRTD